MKYFTLNSDTFIWIKKSQVLLYGSNNGNHLLLDLSDGVRSLCEKLIDVSNLYCVSFDDTDEDVVSFINESVSRNLGAVSEESGDNIAIPPLLKVQHDINRVDQDEEDMYFLRYLSSLTIYLGGDCEPNNYHTQIDYPFPSKQTIPLKSVVDFVLENNRNTLSKIKFILPVFDAEQITTLLTDLHDVCHKIEVVIRYTEVLKNRELLTNVAAQIEQVIIICEPDDDVEILEGNFMYNLITRSEMDYEKWLAIVDSKICKYDIVPIYDDNRTFFEKNIQITPDEILASQPSKRMIYIHQTINLFNWGKLYVYPDGSVYSKCGGERIGYITEPLNVLVGRELRANHSWRRTRNFKMCRDCILQFLCPSPALFEYESSDVAMLACKRKCSPTG